jgi:hypothetical protein
VVIRAHQVGSYVPGVKERASDSGRYEIRVQGLLHPRWSAWFDGVTVTHESNGTTLIRGDAVDQAALHGLLRKLADLGLPLLAVTHLGPDTPTTPSPTTTRSTTTD